MFLDRWPPQTPDMEVRGVAGVRAPASRCRAGMAASAARRGIGTATDVRVFHLGRGVVMASSRAQAHVT